MSLLSKPKKISEARVVNIAKYIVALKPQKFDMKPPKIGPITLERLMTEPNKPLTVAFSSLRSRRNFREPT